MYSLNRASVRRLRLRALPFEISSSEKPQRAVRYFAGDFFPNLKRMATLFKTAGCCDYLPSGFLFDHDCDELPLRPGFCAVGFLGSARKRFWTTSTEPQ